MCRCHIHISSWYESHWSCNCSLLLYIRKILLLFDCLPGWASVESHLSINWNVAFFIVIGGVCNALLYSILSILQLFHLAICTFDAHKLTAWHLFCFKIHIYLYFSGMHTQLCTISRSYSLSASDVVAFCCIFYSYIFVMLGMYLLALYLQT